ncbi:MAG: hypothetical protein J5533_08860 [Bacteroidales bacterium]|nr:hypothetical protein [Bacteroidales bacterium]
MRKAAVILSLLLACFSASGQDIPACADMFRNQLVIPGDSTRLKEFAARMIALRDNPEDDVCIWHIGGSHVQAGFFSSRLRHNFDSLGNFPYAGRGFIFPYPLAQTNFDRSFRVGYDGEWIGSRSSNPNKKMPVLPRYGIMGIAAYTSDTLACFRLYYPEPFSRLHIMGETSGDVRPVAVSSGYTEPCVRDDFLDGYVVEFPEPVDTVQVNIGLYPGQYFVVTGLLPETPGRHGLTFFSSGVNGARTTTWLERCPDFLTQMSLVHPDLMLLGLGINDSTMPAEDFKPDKFKANYRRLLDAILETAPDCAFVFISNNDSWRYARRRMVHNDNGDAVRQAMLELAEEYGGALWDLFGIMGGNGSATEWREAGLMKDDRLHFTREGYELLGDLLYRALEDLWF